MDETGFLGHRHSTVGDLVEDFVEAEEAACRLAYQLSRTYVQGCSVANQYHITTYSEEKDTSGFIVGLTI